LGCYLGDRRVDLGTVGDDRGDQRSGQGGRGRIPFRFGQMTLQDRLGGALAEVGLEDRRERESAPGPPSALLVSLRRHRRSP
jgi:hypothetical protein